MEIQIKTNLLYFLKYLKKNFLLELIEKTEGLSIKYPELEKFKNRKIVLLDSAGLENPVL